MDEPSSEPPPLEVFLERYREDREAGAVRPLHEYLGELSELLGQHPGADTAIAREYETLESAAVRSVLPAAPERLGDYELLEEIGRGGQATVYRSRDVRTGRLVALKILRHAGSAPAIERFRREAGIASRIRDPSIAEVYESGIEHGLAFIAMELLEGESLAERNRHTVAEGLSSLVVEFDSDGDEAPTDAETDAGAPEDVEGILALFERIARALHVAHEHGIVHRDLKPGNLWIRPDGTPVIMDFGLARDLESELQTLTRSGDLFGTPAYMSPEQLLAQRVSVDRRTDIWSLGVTLFEALTLERPFQAPARDALYHSILTKEPPDPRALNEGISADLRTVLFKAIDKDRDHRYPTALELAGDLERARKGQPVSARPRLVAPEDGPIAYRDVVREYDRLKADLRKQLEPRMGPVETFGNWILALAPLPILFFFDGALLLWGWILLLANLTMAWLLRRSSRRTLEWLAARAEEEVAGPSGETLRWLARRAGAEGTARSRQR